MKHSFLLKAMLLTFFVFITITLNAQTSLEGEIRPRYELRDGFKQLRDTGTLPAMLVTQRSRFILNYAKNNLAVKLSFQDVRVWGDEKLKTDVPSTALHEAWVELRLLDSLTLRAGRQEISYDNQRIMSNSNWLQTGASHDALLVKYHRYGWVIDVGSAFNQLSDATVFGTDYTLGQGNYKALNYAWITKKMPYLSLSGVFITDEYQLSLDTIHSRFTWGSILSIHKDYFSMAVRSFFQGGKTINGQIIKANYLNADIALYLGDATPAIGFEYFSGKNNAHASDKHYRAFNYLYGTGQKFNGHMGYFLRPESTRLAGLLDFYLTLNKKMSPMISFGVDYHYFALPNPYLNPINNQYINRYLGFETDIMGRYMISKESTLQAGYCFLQASRSMAILQGRGDTRKLNQWFYVMLTVKPSFWGPPENKGNGNFHGD